MSRRRTPIEQMRQLADDGMEPWQIAAALGVRETAVLVALDATTPAGGAVRAVEDAASLVGKMPDTLGPTRPMTRALAEHVAVTVCGPDDVDETGGATEHPAGCDCCTCELDLISLDPAEAARRARDEAADRALDAMAAPAVDEQPAAAAAAAAEPDPEHEHDPFPVVDETGVWHAECECGTRWDRSPCEHPGCSAFVAALHIARTGTRRHAHHPA